jgi:hypothetical protein
MRRKCPSARLHCWIILPAVLSAVCLGGDFCAVAVEKGKAQIAPTRGPAKLQKPATPAEEARIRQDETKRIEHFRSTGVWLWPSLSVKEQAAELAKRKEYVRKVSEKFSALHMRLYETQYFLFLTDMPAQSVATYTSCLDVMHGQLCNAYSIRDRGQVWLGKLPVVAFVGRESFEEFERTFFKNSIDGALMQGVAHKYSGGQVIVSCHCGKDPSYFASVLVHETTHGFNHRYRSAKQLPSWLDEGIAEWTAMTVVQNNAGIRRKIQVGLKQAVQQGSLGGTFFADGKIERWQYGVAVSMVDFMLKTSGRSFRRLIDLIKTGTPWRDALRQSYGLTPEGLAAAYGRSVGIPNLKP